MPLAFTAALAGLGFGLALIVAIGAQNAFVLRQGLRREHVFVIVAICALADALLIFIGVAGLGAIITQVEWLLLVIEVVGGLFLCTYGVTAAKRAWKPAVLTAETGGGRRAAQPQGCRRDSAGPDVPQPPRLPRHRSLFGLGCRYL